MAIRRRRDINEVYLNRNTTVIGDKLLGSQQEEEKSVDSTINGMKEAEMRIRLNLKKVFENGCSEV